MAGTPVSTFRKNESPDNPNEYIIKQNYLLCIVCVALWVTILVVMFYFS